MHVPSLLLWGDGTRRHPEGAALPPDPLFILQLLLLTCLIVGLARPYVSAGDGMRQPGRHIFVLDTSASMQAREAQRARFDEARAQALDLLRAFAVDEEVMLLTTAPAPEVRLNFTRNHQAVAETLERLAPADVGGDLSLALDFAGGQCSGAMSLLSSTSSLTFRGANCRSRPQHARSFRWARPTKTSASSFADLSGSLPGLPQSARLRLGRELQSPRGARRLERPP